MQSRPGSVQFLLTTGTRTVDTEALEKIKLALQAYLDGPAFPARYLELRDPMRAELTASVAWIRADKAGIGLWKLEIRNDRLTLVRYPPPTKGPEYLYHAALEQDDAGWRVVSFEVEREFGPI